MNVFQFAPKGAPSFSPDSVAGLVRWYNLRTGAAYQTTDTSGSLATAADDPVGCVVDQVNGGSTRLVASNGTDQRPTLKTAAGPAGRRFLNVAAGKKMTESFTLAYPFTRFDVIRVTAGWTVGNYVLGGYSAIERGLLQPYPAGRLRMYTDSTAGPDVALTGGAWLVATQVFNATAMRINPNNTTDATGAGATGAAPNGFRLGDLTYPVPFDWAETLVYNVTVSAPDRSAIAAYLMSKYGVS